MKGDFFVEQKKQSIFSSVYWVQAAKELTNVRILIFTALMIALRVALKSTQIPVVPNQLNIGVGFLVNALGAMTFGPVVAIIAAAISDTVGAFLFPSGGYFFPFIFVEIAGSLIFALFFYKRKVTIPRIILARLAVVVACNFILNPMIMRVYIGESYQLITVLRVVKNICMFPVECLLLILFFQAILPVLKITGFYREEIVPLKLSLWKIILLALISILAVAAFMFYREITKPGTFPFLNFIH